MVYMHRQKILFVTGDVVPSSAQGIRYYQLSMMSDADLPMIFLSYSEVINVDSSNSKSYTVTSHKMQKTLRRILCKILFPDVYVFRILKYKKAISDLIEKDNIGIVILGLQPFSLMILSKFLKCKKPDLRLIADVSDPFSFNMGLMGHPCKRWIASRLEARYLPLLSNMIVLNSKIKDVYEELYPELTGKVVVIEQGIELDFVNKVNLFAGEKYENFTFLYAGSFYNRGRNPSNLYNAFKLKIDDCNLQIYGNVKKKLRPTGCRNVFFHSAVDRIDLMGVTSQANALIIMDNEYGYQVPGKTLETLALSKPVLFVYSNDFSPTLKYVNRSKGIVYAKNELHSIRKGIEQILKDKDSELIRCFDYSQYTWNVLSSKFIELIKRIEEK
jgi:hypothetical protein